MEFDGRAMATIAAVGFEPTQLALVELKIHPLRPLGQTALRVEVTRTARWTSAPTPPLQPVTPFALSRLRFLSLSLFLSLARAISIYLHT